MHKLFPYFEREMTILRQNAEDATKRHPTLAPTLALSGGQCADPAAQRVMQGTALLGAHLSWKLDHYHTRLTSDLLAILGPFYLNPVPSCSVASFGTAEKRSNIAIPRGTELRSKATPACRFRTVYDVAIPAISITASYTTRIDAPLSLGLPADAGGAITIAIESCDAKVALNEAATSPVRLCIDTDTATRSALYDALFARALCTCVESHQQWRKLAETPLVPVGFAAGEALLPTPRRQDDSLRLLAEYFALPEKFEFFDIDLRAVLSQCPRGARRVVLHVLLPDMHKTSTPNLLRALPATALRLGCTPVINMYSDSAEQIRVKDGQSSYPLTLKRNKDSDRSIYKVDAVKLLRAGQDDSTAIDMAWYHGRTAAREKHCWLFKLPDTTAGVEAAVSFVDDKHRPLQLNEGTAKVRVTCTDGQMPAALPVGRTGGDLVGERVAADYTIGLLSTPTRPLEFADRPDVHLDAIAAITANDRAVTQWHLPALLELLRLHARPDCAVTERQMAGIVGIERRETLGKLAHEYGASLVYGYEIHLTIDEASFAHRSIYAFARVLDYVLGYYTPRGNFTRLIVQATDGRELVRCAQRPGAQSPA